MYPCNEKKKLVKTHQFFLKTITLKTGKPFEILVTYARKAWLNGVIMAKWLVEVYHPHLLSTGQDITESILFMDNCSVHRTDECLSFFTRTGAAYEFFPPHFTPLLQPLDQSYNREFKREFSKEWAEWFQAIGCFGRTPKGNRKAASQDEVNRWVANALSRLTPHMLVQVDVRCASPAAYASRATVACVELPSRVADSRPPHADAAPPPLLQRRGLPLPSSGGSCG